MNAGYTYSDVMDRKKAIEDYLISEIGKMTEFNVVSKNIGDLVDNINYPICVVFTDNLLFNEGNQARMIISVVIKNKGSDSDSNNDLIKLVCGVLEDQFLSRNCLLSWINSIDNEIGTKNAASVEIKDVFSRIEVEVSV